MDGVCVKISEKYKPPPRINLAITYSQRISLNRQIQDVLAFAPRDFSVDTNVLGRMGELKDARRLMCEEKRARAERIREKRLKFDDEQKQKEAKVAEETQESQNGQETKGKKICVILQTFLY